MTLFAPISVANLKITHLCTTLRYEYRLCFSHNDSEMWFATEIRHGPSRELPRKSVATSQKCGLRLKRDTASVRNFPGKSVATSRQQILRMKCARKGARKGTRKGTRQWRLLLEPSIGAFIPLFRTKDCLQKALLCSNMMVRGVKGCDLDRLGNKVEKIPLQITCKPVDPEIPIERFNQIPERFIRIGKRTRSAPEPGSGLCSWARSAIPSMRRGG